jgi:hypothetical protein
MKKRTLFIDLGLILVILGSCAIPPTCALRLTPSSLSIRKGEVGIFNANADAGCNPSPTTTIGIDTPDNYPFNVSFNPSQGATTSSTGSVTVNTGAAVGTYNVTVRVSNNGQSVGASLQITILQ